jgi:FAD synthase
MISTFSVFSWRDVLERRVVPEGAKTALTVGVFDGPHIGHIELLDTVLGAREQRVTGSAAEDGGVAGVTPRGEDARSPAEGVARDRDAGRRVGGDFPLTPHHAFAGAITFAGMDIPLVSTVRQRVDFFKKKGFDFAIVIDFSRDFSKMEGREFVSLLVDNCGMAFLCEGDDFRCGYKGSCDVREIGRLSRELSFDFAVKESVVYEGRKVSSSRIRDDVRGGRFDAAREMLGRPYTLDLRGAEKGFWRRVADGTNDGIAAPNGNFLQILPKPGTYAVTVAACGRRVETAMTVSESETTIHGQDTPVTEIIFGQTEKDKE